MNSILDRIAKIADNENITIGALEKKIGASKGVLSRALQKKTDIQSKWLKLIVENYPLYSSEWLLTGNGKMLKTENQSISSKEILPEETNTLLSILDRKEKRIEELVAENAILKEKVRELVNRNAEILKNSTTTLLDVQEQKPELQTDEGISNQLVAEPHKKYITKRANPNK